VRSVLSSANAAEQSMRGGFGFTACAMFDHRSAKVKRNLFVVESSNSYINSAAQFERADAMRPCVAGSAKTFFEIERPPSNARRGNAARP
jgi:hypothetical protein